MGIAERAASAHAQDPADRKYILADEALMQLTGERRFSGFSFSRLMQPHLNPT